MAIVVQGSCLDFHQLLCRCAVVGFDRLDGFSWNRRQSPAGPLAGCSDIDSSDIIDRFVRICDAFNIPLQPLSTPRLFLREVQVHFGFIRHGAKVFLPLRSERTTSSTLLPERPLGVTTSPEAPSDLFATGLLLAWWPIGRLGGKRHPHHAQNANWPPPGPAASTGICCEVFASSFSISMSPPLWLKSTW